MIQETERIKIANEKIWKLKPTHCLELFRQMQMGDDIKVEKSYYTAKGIEAIITDRFDGQQYKLSLVPTK